MDTIYFEYLRYIKVLEFYQLPLAPPPPELPPPPENELPPPEELLPEPKEWEPDEENVFR